MFGLKKYILFLVIFPLSVMAAAQDSLRYDYVGTSSPNNSTGILSSSLFYVGFGVDGYYPYAGPYYSESPNIMVMYERPLIKAAGPGSLNLGALFSFKQLSSYYYDESSNYNYSQTWNYYTIGTKLTYRLNFPVLFNFEPYAGIMGAYNMVGFKYNSNDPFSDEPTSPGYYLKQNTFPNYFSLGIFAGAMAPLTKRVNFWFEAGYGYTTLAAGFCFKL